MLVVRNHNKFRRFDYTNQKSNIELGTLIFKHDKAVEGSEPEIGVVIQTHGQDEYRTDMFGNGYLGEDSYHGVERFATIEDVKKYRPALLHNLTSLERYPEFTEVVKTIVKETVKRINQLAPKVESEMPYKTQFTLEEVIKKLQELV